MDNDGLRAIERSMIVDDANFLMGLFAATQQLPEKSTVPYLFSCIDFYSLVVHETYNYLAGRDLALAAKLNHGYADVIRQSRQRMKLYDDKKLGIAGIGKTLLDIITPAHQEELSKAHRFKLPKWMWDDISLYFVKDNPVAIGSTHLASFNMGIDIVRMFDPTTATEFGRELGRFLSAIANKPAALQLHRLTIIPDDMRSERLYTEQRYGSSHTTVNAGLSIIDMNLNFMALCLPPGVQHTTLFKWKFLTAYHALSSLKVLYGSPHAGDVAADTLCRVKRVLDTDFAKLLQTPGANMLRNTLTHYGIDTRLDGARLSTEQSKLYGLVEASLPDWSYDSLADRLDLYLQKELLNMFQVWK